MAQAFEQTADSCAPSREWIARHEVLRIVIASWLLVLVMSSPSLSDDATGTFEFFENKIRPVLVKHCYECHSGAAQSLEGGLLLDTRDAVRAGGDTGPAIVPGDVDNSLLLQAIAYQELEMPPGGKLPDSVIADFRKWVLAGAPDPRDDHGSGDDHGESVQADYVQARHYWAFRPATTAPLPRIARESWPTSAVDYFILERLLDQGLAAAPPSAREQLVRRVHFDATGLPPTPDDVAQYVHDTSPDAYERLVDRLLASPRYGENWAQDWLDVVRYAETEGFEYDRMMPGAWRYRDYVVQSFNADKPYDRFLIEQLAGDEIDPSDQTLRVASGFHRLGAVRRNAGNQKVASSRNEVLTERTDIIGAVFLGLTIGCARCHDHKFDPIPQIDYYRLQAFLAGTQEDNVSLASEQEQDRWKRATKAIEDQISELKDSLEGALDGDREQRVRSEIEQLESLLPPPLATLCSISNDSKNVTPIFVLRRGDTELPGAKVGMRALGVLLPDDAPEHPPDTAMPRTLLANWLTEPTHPLTARVMANRIWQHYFGRGIVSTANDFGENGAHPTHPRLLDYLARRLVDSDWRIKTLDRTILLSSTYRQSSNSPRSARGHELDAENHFLWHFPRRRLSAEEIRDAMLAVAGRLNHRVGGPSVMLPVDQQLVQQLYKPSQWNVTADRSEHTRRSIYLVAKRNLRLPFMEVFDQPPAQTSCPQRQQSTHAPQSLELLNGRITNRLAGEFAARIRRDVGDQPSAQIDRAFQLALGRAATQRERELACQFIAEVSLREFSLAMLNLNAFLYVD